MSLCRYCNCITSALNASAHSDTDQSRWDAGNLRKSIPAWMTVPNVPWAPRQKEKFFFSFFQPLQRRSLTFALMSPPWHQPLLGYFLRRGCACSFWQLTSAARSFRILGEVRVTDALSVMAAESLTALTGWRAQDILGLLSPQKNLQKNPACMLLI